MGGPAYYIERALHCKPYVILLGMVVCGGIKRIGKIAEYMAPVMCVVYVALAVGVIGMNITAAPGVFKMIVSSAFGIDPIFGAIIGSAISWGVKRDIYSNEAGQGSGAIVSSSAECSHPAKQGLVQAFSGCILNGEIIWTMGDIGCGSMAWLNIIAILLLFNKGFALLKDYEKQKKEGKDPVFRPTEFGIEMIASESTAPLAVMGLTGSVFTNKTLEGYPGKRFQAGSHIADRVEELACQRACKASG